MTGKITVGTIQDTDGTTVASTVITSGSCKSWLGIDQIGTQAIHGSYNISSISDNSVGTTNLSFTNSFSTVNYIGIGADHNSGVSAGASPYTGDPDAASHSTSGTVIQCYAATNAAIRDTAYVGYHAMGDLA